MRTRRDMVLGAAGASLAAPMTTYAQAGDKPEARPARSKAKGAAGGGIVDVHAHLILPEFTALMKKFGVEPLGYGSAPAAGIAPPPPPSPPPPAILSTDEQLENRIAFMDEAGVARQILSTTTAPYLETEAHAVEAARMLNDVHAGVVAKHPTRFSAFAALPLPHIDASLKELKRGMDELGMAGVGIQCFCLDRSPADDHFLPIYEELNRRGAVLFFHPCINGICSPFVGPWGLNGTAGAVYEDGTVALHLIIKQIPTKFPRIKIIIPHFGGVMPMLLDRLDNQLPMTISGLPEKPSITARRFWYDSVGHGSKAACNCAVEAFGADRILPGSDYPVLLPFETYRETFDYMRHVGLSADQVDRMLYRNARDVFGAGIDKPAPFPARRADAP